MFNSLPLEWIGQLAIKLHSLCNWFFVNTELKLAVFLLIYEHYLNKLPSQGRIYAFTFVWQKTKIYSYGNYQALVWTKWMSIAHQSPNLRTHRKRERDNKKSLVIFISQQITWGLSKPKKKLFFTQNITATLWSVLLTSQWLSMN